MFDTICEFLTFLTIFIDLYAYYHLLSHKLNCRFSSKNFISLYILSAGFYLLGSCSNFLFPGYPLKGPFFLLFFAALFFLFKDSFLKRALWIVTSFFILLVCELFIALTIFPLTRNTFTDMAESPFLQLVGTILARILLLVIIKIIIYSGQKVFENFTSDCLLIISVCVGYALTIISLFYLDNIFITAETAMTLSLFAMLLISALALYLLQKIARKSDEIMTTNLKLQQIEMEHKQNQDMALVVEDLRALRHDMNNHMSVLQGLLTMGEYADAQAYLSTITEELTVANSFLFIDNKVLSVLINNKISKARQAGITFEPELLTSVTPFSDSDLCALLGNLLENAIEASAGHANPYIYFSMQKANGQLLIQCDNTYTVPPVFEKGQLVTTKADKAYHGIGTKTIRSIVENYHGTATFTVDDMFHVHITVPLS